MKLSTIVFCECYCNVNFCLYTFPCNAFKFLQHDAQMDYYGIRLATCSSDRTVKIFDVRNGAQKIVATLKGYVCHIAVKFLFIRKLSYKII